MRPLLGASHSRATAPPKLPKRSALIFRRAASEINPAVNQLVSRTVHKAMAKQPWHRFASAREFGETLQRALRNEPIERFERSKILPRIERVKKAYSEGDHQFALEILRELESEGHVDPDMSVLHIQIDQALRRKSIVHLLDNARIRMEEEEFPLALHKVEDALAIEPGHADALLLKEQIEKRRDETQLSHWFRLVREHLDNNLFGQARQGLQEILKIDSSNTEAREMLAHIDQTEQEIVKNREEKQRLYESAVESYRNGEINTALTHLDRLWSLLAVARVLLRLTWTHSARASTIPFAANATMRKALIKKAVLSCRSVTWRSSTNLRRLFKQASG